MKVVSNLRIFDFLRIRISSQLTTTNAQYHLTCKVLDSHCFAATKNFRGKCYVVLERFSARGIKHCIEASLSWGIGHDPSIATNQGLFVTFLINEETFNIAGRQINGRCNTATAHFCCCAILTRALVSGKARQNYESRTLVIEKARQNVNRGRFPWDPLE